MIKEEVKKLFEKFSKGEISGLGFDKAYELIQELHKKIGIHQQTKQDFVQEFAKLDFDGDEKVTERELINYELRQLYYQEILLIGICWIGQCIDTNTIDPKTKQRILQGVEDKPDKDGNTFYPWFEVTYLGEPICINEYGTDIASGPNTHVM